MTKYNVGRKVNVDTRQVRQCNVRAIYDEACIRVWSSVGNDRDRPHEYVETARKSGTESNELWEVMT